MSIQSDIKRQWYTLCKGHHVITERIANIKLQMLRNESITDKVLHVCCTKVPINASRETVVWFIGGKMIAACHDS